MYRGTQQAKFVRNSFGTIMATKAQQNMHFLFQLIANLHVSIFPAGMSHLLNPNIFPSKNLPVKQCSDNSNSHTLVWGLRGRESKTKIKPHSTRQAGASFISFCTTHIKESMVQYKRLYLQRGSVQAQTKRTTQFRLQIT